MNLKIKYRESFRPFAPSVLTEKAGEWFEMTCESPYMLLVTLVKRDKRIAVEENLQNAPGFEKLKIPRSLIPAVTHVDYSARIQTVNHEDNPLYHNLIQAFYKKTGCPVIINTSFNVRGEPLVCTPEDAFRCFMRTEMDFLAMGSFLLDKTKQKQAGKNMKGKEEFEPD